LFFKYVTTFYQELIRNFDSIFRHKPVIRILDTENVDIQAILADKFSGFQIIKEKEMSKENQTVKKMFSFKAMLQ
jgi:hypothetical protein